METVEHLLFGSALAVALIAYGASVWTTVKKSPPDKKS